MSWQEIGASIDAHNKKIVMHNTWGHLYPDQPNYEGTVRISKDIYGQTTVLDESNTLPQGSPWWHAAIFEFANEVSTDMEGGEVIAFKICVDIVECIEDQEDWLDEDDYEPEEWNEIHIKSLVKTILIKPF